MYVLLGSNGQITSKLARLLLAAGHPVRAVGRNRNALAPLARAGAQLAIGDPADPAFLREAFAGATAAYTMIPPCYAEPNMRRAQDRIGTSIATALGEAPVPRIVNLSSIGAELPQGTGPIEGLHAQEQRLDALGMHDLLHLRPGYFMENLLAGVADAATLEQVVGMEAADLPMPMVATADIAAVAARELVTPQHRGALLLHAPAHVTMREAASAIGAALGKPALPYVQLTPEQAKPALVAQGFSADAADQLAALARWVTSSLASTRAAPVLVQPTTIEAFARASLAAVPQAA